MDTKKKDKAYDVRVELTKDGVVLDGTLAPSVTAAVERCFKQFPEDKFIAPFVEYDKDSGMVSFIKVPKGLGKRTLKDALGAALNNGERAKSRANVVTRDIKKLWAQYVKAKKELAELAEKSGFKVTVKGKPDGTVTIVSKELPKAKKSAPKKDKDLFEQATKHAAKAHAEAVADQA